MWVQRVLRVLVAAGLVVVAVGVGAGPSGAGPSGGALADVSVLEVEVAGKFGVPLDAEMVALNVTTSRSAGPGFLTVFSCDGDFPDTSNLNFGADENIPNVVLAKVGVDGMVCLSGSDVTDVIVDLAGYVPASSPMTPLSVPIRVVDTRSATGMTKLQPGVVQSFDPIGLGGIPLDAGAVFYNLTALGRQDGGFITAFPCGLSQPDTSTVNFGPDRNVPNFVMSKLGSGGVCLVSSVAVDVLVDIAGWVPDDASGLELLEAPQRLFDTRNTVGGPAGKMAAGETRTVDAMVAGAPADAVAVIGNLTQAGPVSPGFSTLYPCDVAEPDTSNLNWATELARANAVIVKLSAAGTVCVTASAATHLILDVTGYITDVALYTPVTPLRIYDSRQNWQADCRLFLKREGPAISVFEVSETPLNPADLRATVVMPDGLGARSTKIARDCDSVLLLGGTGIWRAGFDGSFSLSEFGFTYDPDLPFPGEVHGFGELDDGSLYVQGPTGFGGAAFARLDGSLIWETAGGASTQEPAISFDGSKVVAIIQRGSPRFIEVYDVLSGDLLNSISVPGFFEDASVAFTPDGSRIVVNIRNILVPADDPLFEFVQFYGLVSILDTNSLEELDAVADADGAMHPHAVGRGQVWLCAASGLFEWDIYGDVRALARRGTALYPETQSGFVNSCQESF